MMIDTIFYKDSNTCIHSINRNGDDDFKIPIDWIELTKNEVSELLNPVISEEQIQERELAIAQTELSAVQNEVRLLEKKRDKNRASSMDLERLNKLEDYAFDLDDFITGQRPDLPSKPE